MGSVKMKLFSLFAVFSAAAASNVEIWDEYGNVAYVDYEERGNANFGPPAKGPRECDGKKNPRGQTRQIHLQSSEEKQSKRRKQQRIQKEKMQIRLRRGMERQVDQTGQSIQKKQEMVK